MSRFGFCLHAQFFFVHGSDFLFACSLTSLPALKPFFDFLRSPMRESKFVSFHNHPTLIDSARARIVALQAFCKFCINLLLPGFFTLPGSIKPREDFFFSPPFLLQLPLAGLGTAKHVQDFLVSRTFKSRLVCFHHHSVLIGSACKINTLS